MVALAGNLASSPECEKVRSDLQTAREEYALLVEEYTHLTTVVRENLETEYQVKIGKKEHELFACHVEILRLKREISLYQAAGNRGETISPDRVKKIIEKEFAQYLEQLEKQKAELKLAMMSFSAEKLSTEECHKIKKVYRDLVRRLHPDLNPDLASAAKALWERVQEAYRMNDWKELNLLMELADEILSNKNQSVSTDHSLEYLQKELDKVIKKSAELKQKIEETRERVPYVYEKLLLDPLSVMEKRKKLSAEIKLCQDRIRDLKKILENFGGE